MNMRKLWEREKYVAIHAQTWRFRVVKYLVLLAIGIGVYQWGGWPAVGAVFFFLLLIALSMHFIFRWKTKAWTESWGPYKKLDLPE